MRAMSCKYGVNHHGNLRFRIYWRGMSIQERAESSEGTALRDTPENRAKMQAKVDQINAEIKAETFDYLKHFPRGNRAQWFEEQKNKAEPKTIRSFYEEWITKFQPPLAKKSQYRGYKSHFEAHILPTHGDKLLNAYGVADIRALMSILVGRGVSIKTMKNILNASLRALFRDACAEQLITANPFRLLPPRWWPKHRRPPPDPFTESERDEILNYLRSKFYPQWPVGYVFCYTLFWTGMRPSELTARKWGDIDFRTGKLAITSSRTAGQDGPTKTAGSTRTIEIFPTVLELWKSIKPLRAQPDDYIFLNRDGDPLDHWYFGQRYFQAALTKLEIRHRDFYQTRATFISVLLSSGENPKQIAEYCGNSPEIIYQSYGKYIGQTGTFGAAALAAVQGESRHPTVTQAVNN